MVIQTTRHWKLKMFGLALLPCLLIAAALGAKAAHAQTPQQQAFPQLNFWLQHGDPTSFLRGYVDFYVYVNSGTDTTVSNAAITIAHCREGQQGAFHIKRTRHLVPGQERLRAQVGGEFLEWDITTVPSVRSTPLSLHLKVLLDRNRDGPFLCIQAQGLVGDLVSPAMVNLTWITIVNMK